MLIGKNIVLNLKLSRNVEQKEFSSLQGHIYLRDFIFDEHSYSEAIFIPDGKYIIHGRVFTQYNNKSHLMAEAFTHVEIKSVEIH